MEIKEAKTPAPAKLLGEKEGKSSRGAEQSSDALSSSKVMTALLHRLKRRYPLFRRCSGGNEDKRTEGAQPTPEPKEGQPKK